MQNTKNLEHDRAKVLIVDDEPDICFLLSELLKQKNMVPLVANNLNDAEAALANSHPQYLFLDNWLPDGFGLDFISFIKKNFPSTKVIMMTAHDSIADRKRAFSEGADFFISKPLTKQLISEAISAIA